MKIAVTVKTNSRQESVMKLVGAARVAQSVQAEYLIKVNAPPIDGAANERVIELLAKTFGCPKSYIRLVSGHRGKKKIFEVIDG